MRGVITIALFSVALFALAPIATGALPSAATAYGGNTAVQNALNTIVPIVVPLTLYGGGIAGLVYSGLRLAKRRGGM